MKIIVEFFKAILQRNEIYQDIDNHEGIDSNVQSLSVFSLIAALCTLIMFIYSQFDSVISKQRAVYFLFIIISLGTFMLTRYLYHHHPKMIKYVVYLTIAAFLAYGIVLGVYTDATMQSTTFMVMMIFVPLLFTTNPIHSASIIIGFDVVFMILCHLVKSGAVLTADIANGIIFGMLAVISTFYMNFIKYGKALSDRELKKMGAYDQLTGLLNRNSYEKFIEEHNHKDYVPFACVFVDVNGLHELNNTQGHAAGDKMLKTVAQKLTCYFGENQVYRIGGDEFVAFIENQELSKIEDLSNKCVKEVEECGYHIAVGVEYKLEKGLNIQQMIHSAEKKMYNSKAVYYSSLEHDRRRRN